LYKKIEKTDKKENKKIKIDNFSRVVKLADLLFFILFSFIKELSIWFSILLWVIEFKGWIIILYLIGKEIYFSVDKFTSRISEIVFIFSDNPWISIYELTTLIFKSFHSTLKLVLLIIIDSPFKSLRNKL